jgi:hypothetical protein
MIFFIYYEIYNVSLECFMQVQNMLWGLSTNINTININKHNININYYNTNINKHKNVIPQEKLFKILK